MIDDYVAAVSGETVTLKVGEQEKSFPMTDIGLTCSNPEVVKEAYDYGKAGNLLERSKLVYELTVTPKAFPLNFSYD